MFEIDIFKIYNIQHLINMNMSLLAKKI